MVAKKKRSVRRTAKKRTGRKRVAAKRATPKRRSSAKRQRTTKIQSVRKKRASKSRAVRRKERTVEEARHRLIDAEKEFAVKQLPKKVHPATKKRGADPHVPSKSGRRYSGNSKEQKLEQGLEESMAGSDAVSVTQPGTPIAEKPEDHPEARDGDSSTDATQA